MTEVGQDEKDGAQQCLTERNAAIDCELDLRHLKCPMPLIRTRQYLGKMRPGQRLLVKTADIGSHMDIPNMLELLHHRLIARGAKNGFDWLLIERGPGSC